MRAVLTKFFNGVALILVVPLAATCWITSALGRGGTETFRFWGQFLALVPGLPGSYLRRAYYRLTLESCAADCHIGFGALFAHRDSRVGSGVYVGNYAMLGKVDLNDDCLIGSRTSILSGQNQHRLSPDGRWLPSDLDDFVTVTVGVNAWIGEAAVIMADVGRGAAVSAGSVVSNPLPEFVVVAGNPARFVRKVEVEQSTEPSAESAVQNSQPEGVGKLGAMSK